MEHLRRQWQQRLASDNGTPVSEGTWFRGIAVQMTELEGRRYLTSCLHGDKAAAARQLKEMLTSASRNHPRWWGGYSGGGQDRGIGRQWSNSESVAWQYANGDYSDAWMHVAVVIEARIESDVMAEPDGTWTYFAVLEPGDKVHAVKVTASLPSPEEARGLLSAAMGIAWPGNYDAPHSAGGDLVDLGVGFTTVASSALPAWWADWIGDPSRFDVVGDKVRLYRTVPDPGGATAAEVLAAELEDWGRIGCWWGSIEMAVSYGTDDDSITFEALVPIAAVEHRPQGAGAFVPAGTPIEIQAVIRQQHRMPLTMRTTASGQLYWRLHANGRPFTPEAATSKPWYGEGADKGTQQGFSCFDEPWLLWVYLDAAMIGTSDAQIVAFTGERMADTGNDGEDLVVPDMQTVQRMSIEEFERRLLTAPLPKSPKRGGQGRSTYNSWSSVKRYLHEEFDGAKPGRYPLVERVLKEAASWRGLMEGPVWTMAPAVILVDKLGRQNTYEVYVGGQQKTRRPTLAEAKAYVERIAGVMSWRRYEPEPQKADHYYFGVSDEFTDPTIAYLGEPA